MGEMLQILLIEDDTALAMGTEYSLTDEGMDVTCAVGFEDVAELLERQKKKFDCVLLDVMLPGKDGFEICRWIRQQDETLPIIFLTALSDEGNIVRGLNLGGDDYVTKPFRTKELVARIYANVRKSAHLSSCKQDGGAEESGDKSVGYGGAERIWKEGNLVIDRDCFTVHKDGQLLNLTPSEYRLLTELINHAGQVITREQLMERLWSVDEAFVDDNTLSVYVRRLREKLGDEGGKTYIKTVRGVGYTWEMENC